MITSVRAVIFRRVVHKPQANTRKKDMPMENEEYGVKRAGKGALNCEITTMQTS